MTKLLRILAIGVGAVVALVAVSIGAVYVVSQRRIDASLTVAGHAVLIPTDSASIERGRHVVNAIGMSGDCHQADFGGGVMIDVPVIAYLSALNLTSGEGGVGGMLSDLDWERAVRHGVAPGGRKLHFMPAHEYANINDEDFAAAVAYLKQVPKVARKQELNRFGPLGRALFLKGDIELLPADLMDHTAAHPAVIPPAPTAEYGKYPSVTCRGCHAHTFSGGPMPGAPPDWKAPANITPEGIGRSAEADFARALRESKRPDGSALDTMYMPVRFTKNLNDTEVQALYAFLKTLPPKPYGGR